MFFWSDIRLAMNFQKTVTYDSFGSRVEAVESFVSCHFAKTMELRSSLLYHVRNRVMASVNVLQVAEFDE